MLTEEGLMHIPGVLSRWATLRSGARAHYVTSGETGPSLLLLHGGIAGSSGMAGWGKIMPALGKHFRVYAPDRPGFGLCDTRPEHWMANGVRDQVRFIDEFVEAVGFEDQFFLCGNSQGAQMGASYAVEFPDRISRMILISTPAFHARLGLGDRLAGAGGDPFDGSDAWMRRQLDRLYYKKEALTDELIQMRVRHANHHKDVLAASQRRSREELKDPNLFQAVNLKGRLDAIAIPTIFIWGIKDTHLCPPGMGKELEQALPNIKFYFPDDMGHVAQADRPQLTTDIIVEWFRDGRISPETEARMAVPETLGVPVHA